MKSFFLIRKFFVVATQKVEHLNDNFQRSALTSTSASSCLDLCKSYEDEIFISVTSTKDINWCWNDEENDRKT